MTSDPQTTMVDNEPIDSDARELAAESITVRIRWFGLAVGYLLVNALGRQTQQPQLNAILTLGAVFAILDTWWSFRGRVLLDGWRLAVSAMEAVFIGLLCYFDGGVHSLFRFYYFLSLLVCAIRHSGSITYATFGLHFLSFVLLGLIFGVKEQDDVVVMLLTLVFLGWATWALTALTGLLKAAGSRLTLLNEKLRDNQKHLEHRIEERTAELQQSQALLVQQEKQAAFGLLAAGIAHEVGNPLASISSIVQMLTRRHDDEYTTERLRMVHEQLSRIQRILRELIGFSRPASSAPQKTDIHAAIKSALNIAKYYKRWKGKNIVTEFADGVPRLMLAHDQLVQVVLNLVLNALDATEEMATIRIATRLENGRQLSASDAEASDTTASDTAVADAKTGPDGNGKAICIDVADEGGGISPQNQARLFQAYFTTKNSGTGLGLFVCRQLAEDVLGGSIALTASGESGSVFTVRIPISAANHVD